MPRASRDERDAIGEIAQLAQGPHAVSLVGQNVGLAFD